MTTEYEKIRDKFQKKVDDLDKEILTLDKKLRTVDDEVDDQEKAKESGKNFNEKKYKVLIKTKKTLEADRKALVRDKTLAEEELKELKDGLENSPGRHNNKEAIEKQIKTFTVEVKKYAFSLGDTTKRLTKEVVATQSALSDLDKKMNVAVQSQMQITMESPNSPELTKITKLIDDLTTQHTALNRKLKITQERLDYYEKTKKLYANMLKDGQITPEEYQLHKKLLKRELRV